MTALLPGREECPGHLQWSAFGARYPDTVCSSALDWTEAGYEPTAILCDADDDFRPKDVPCPFCDPEGFISYQWGGGWYGPVWDDDEQTPVPDRAEIHFHDGDALWFTAAAADGVERRVRFHNYDNGGENRDFEPWIMPNGEAS